MSRITSALLFTVVLCSDKGLAAEMFRISGVAVEATSGQPVKSARIVVAPSGRTRIETASVITSETGRFAFNVPEGKWELYAERQGLPPQSFGSHSLDLGIGIAVVTGARYKTENLIFRLFPPAAISGKVVDESGEPVENALIQLVRSAVSGGRRIVRTARWARTNDIGEYRFAPIGAGTYYLAVTGTPWYAEAQVRRGQTSGLSALSYSPVYFPNTTDPRSAAALVIQPAQEVSADFTMRAQPGYNLTVRCDTEPTEALSLQLIADGIQGVDTFQRVVSFDAPKTTISAVPPGRYRLRLQSEKADGRKYGIETVDIGSADSEVTIRTAVQPTISGSVQFAFGGHEPPTTGLVGLYDRSTGLSLMRPIRPDGTFSIPGVIPGKYRVLVAAKGAYTKDVRIGSTTVPDRLLEIGSSSPGPLLVVAGYTAARVKGFLQRAGAPLPGAIVVIIPCAATAYGADPQGFQTDSDGSYDFDQLRPGDYDLIALDDPEVEYTNPEALRMYETRAKRVHLDGDSSVDVNLELP